ncbi:hypothetical protein Tco_0573408 [Tanacetum coccineum]
MQQFWYSIKKLQGIDSYEFLLANKKCTVNTEVFRKILNIYLRVEGVDFTDVPDDDTALTFLIDLGYKGPLYKHTNMFMDHMHQPWRTLVAIINKWEELLNMIRSFCEKFLQQKQAASIDQSPLQEMSIQDMEDLKQHYLDEILSLGKFNGMSIEINKKKELQRLEQVANLSTYPSQRFKSFCYDDDDDYDYEKSTIPLNKIDSQIPPSIAITPILPILKPEDSLIMGNEELNAIPEKELDKVIKSSVENLVPIPSESEDTSENDSDCDLPSCNDFSPINVYEENSVTFSNPFFDLNDNFTSSDDESLSDEDVPEDNNIESKDSYVSNLDEPALLVTPLSDFNKDECFDPGSDVDEIEFLLHRDPSTPRISVASILEGFTDEPPFEKNDDLFDLESKENEWKKILYDASIDDLMTEDKVFDPNYN